MLGRGKKSKEVVGAGAQQASEPERITNKLDKVLVADSKLPTKKQKAKLLFGRVKSHRRFKPAVVAFVGLVLVSSLLVFLSRGREQPAVVDDGPKCTYAMLEKIKPNLGFKKIERLEPQIKEVENIPGYDTDASCLGVVVTYYINRSDAKKSRELLDKLKVAYAKEGGYDAVIIGDVNEPDVLEGQVKFLEKQAASFAEAADKQQGQKVNPETGEPIVE